MCLGVRRIIVHPGKSLDFLRNPIKFWDFLEYCLLLPPLVEAVRGATMTYRYMEGIFEM